MAGLTSKPRVPAFVRIAALGAWTVAATGCGDDDDNDSASTDVHPTAGPCAHDPDLPECATTGEETVTASTTDATTGSTTGDGMTDPTDVHPTAGPCAHDPDLPECATSSGTDGTTDTTAGDETADSTSTGG